MSWPISCLWPCQQFRWSFDRQLIQFDTIKTYTSMIFWDCVKFSSVAWHLGIVVGWIRGKRWLKGRTPLSKWPNEWGEGECVCRRRSSPDQMIVVGWCATSFWYYDEDVGNIRVILILILILSSLLPSMMWKSGLVIQVDEDDDDGGGVVTMMMMMMVVVVLVMVVMMLMMMERAGDLATKQLPAFSHRPHLWAGWCP